MLLTKEERQTLAKEERRAERLSNRRTRHGRNEEKGCT